MMIYKRGDYGISVQQLDGFGKNPGLWVHDKNKVYKVASFGNSKKAEMFLKYLDWLVLINSKEPKESVDDADI